VGSKGDTIKILTTNLEAMLVPDELFPPNFTPSFDPFKGAPPFLNPAKVSCAFALIHVDETAVERIWHIRQSRPGSGLGCSYFSGERP